MKGHPKFNIGDMVQFNLSDEGPFYGKIYIVDAYGTFEDPSDVSYDIMVENWGIKKEQCLFKHVSEKIVSRYNYA